MDLQKNNLENWLIKMLIICALIVKKIKLYVLYVKKEVHSMETVNPKKRRKI